MVRASFANHRGLNNSNSTTPALFFPMVFCFQILICGLATILKFEHPRGISGVEIFTMFPSWKRKKCVGFLRFSFAGLTFALRNNGVTSFYFVAMKCFFHRIEVLFVDLCLFCIRTAVHLRGEKVCRFFLLLLHVNAFFFLISPTWYPHPSFQQKIFLQAP